MTNTVRALGVPQLDTTACLKLAAEQAGRITGAEGVAIAIGNSMAMCCCASLGNAPDVGVLVGPDSGLSGICMRTSEVVHCEDTAADPRVDPVAGRRMSLRSVLIVPVIVDGHLQAMLQVVSSKPRAFDSQHREYLSHIAHDVAKLLSDADTARPPTPSIAEQQASSRIADSEGKCVEATSPTRPSTTASGRDGTISTASASAAPEAITSNVTAPRGERAVPGSTPASAVPTYILPTTAAWRSLFDTRAVAGIAFVCLLALGGYLIGTRHIFSPASKASTTPSASQQTPPDATPEITIEQSSLSVAGLEEGPKLTGSAPQLTPGRLVRKVEPVYPASARARGISGSVVLTALVTKEGKVANVQLVRGPEALSAAAMEAVRQWVYEPYRLGSAPAAVKTMIVIRFTPHQQP
ncbi:MAG: TonB family protein [Terriglobales bacterium]